MRSVLLLLSFATKGVKHRILLAAAATLKALTLQSIIVLIDELVDFG